MQGGFDSFSGNRAFILGGTTRLAFPTKDDEVQLSHAFKMKHTLVTWFNMVPFVLCSIHMHIQRSYGKRANVEMKVSNCLLKHPEVSVGLYQVSNECTLVPGYAQHSELARKPPLGN